MPQKNTIKEYVPESYYHIYTRGANKQRIFIEASDYSYFIYLFDRYLSGEKKLSKTGVIYPTYKDEVELISFCLMTNHIHMFIYQHENPESLRKLMSSLMTSYSKYFNAKYRRVGSVFESRYKAKRIDNDSYLMHVSRYIHMNPRRWMSYRQSSLKYIHNVKVPKWLNPEIITSEFKTRQSYIVYLEDYQKHKNSLEIIKQELADT